MPRKRKLREPKLHKWSDRCTEIFIYFMVIFSPWAFGTTEYWSIWTMNITAYGLGFFLVTKWIIRWTTGFRPWPSEPPKSEINLRQHRLRLIHKTCTVLSVVLMILLLGYILTSAINARASFNLENHEYTYFEGIKKSLPHSYDARGTWFLFWQYLGLVILFWSTKDWLAGARSTRSAISLNLRLKRLLFLICLNGGALALESILQKIYYNNYNGKLLFLVEPLLNYKNSSQFGPFAYRSNASSFLNLIWPLAMGFFIQLYRADKYNWKRKIGSGPEILLVPCIILCASGPIISSSRGGAFVMVGLLTCSLVIVMFINIRSLFVRMSVFMSLFIGLYTAWYFGWEKTELRLINIFWDNMSNRTQIYETTLKMIGEYGLFGSGPGTFESVVQFELQFNPNWDHVRWESWAHNDYLEFLLTFGRAGFIIVISIFIVVLIQSFLLLVEKNQHSLLITFGLLCVLGIAIHAYFDFPLQVYSIVSLLCIFSAFISHDFYLNAPISYHNIKSNNLNQ